MTQRYKWFSIGDINAFLGLMFDNMTVLSFLAGILIIGFGFPAEIVYKRMFPGTAFGVLVGDLAYTWMAVRLAKKTGNPRVTAIPLGLDTPSTIGIALAVLGPAFLSLKGRMAVEEAALMTWYIGMATMVMIGILKVLLSFCGGWVQRIVPRAGLLGSLAGIGLALLAFLPLTDIFGMPLIGLISLGLILTTFVARIRLPGNLSGVLAAVVAGTALYYLLGPLGLVSGYRPLPPLELHFGLPTPTLLFVNGLREALQYLPIAVPFALLTVVGGINVTESARVAGDSYKTRDVLLTEAVATLAAGICGGVAQSTPYIGQSAYKRMGARAGYTLITGLFVGLGGILGFAGAIVELIPRAVLAPVFVFVALEIIVQATFSCPRRHAPAVVFSCLPTVARLLSIKYCQFHPRRGARRTPRGQRPGDSRGPGHARPGERLHPHRHALGGVFRRAHRPASAAVRRLPGNSRGFHLLRRHPFGPARGRSVSPLAARHRRRARRSLPVRRGLPGAGHALPGAVVHPGRPGTAPGRRGANRMTGLDGTGFLEMALDTDF